MKAIIASVLLVFATTAGASGWGGDTDYNYNLNQPRATAAAAGGSVDSVIRNRVNTSDYNSQGQRQSNRAVGSGNDTNVTIQGDNIPVQKKADVPAYAPNVIASPATAPCYVTFGGSGGVSGMFSIGGAGFVKDHGCAFGEVARRAAAVGNQAIADEALGYMMDIVKADAGVGQPVDTDVPVFQAETAPQDDVLWYAK